MDKESAFSAPFFYMKRTRVILFLGIALLVFSIFPPSSISGVNVNIGISVPPFVISAPPALVVIPGTYVYFIPDIDAQILFYHGYWYRPYEGRWFRGRSYNGPWAYWPQARVPRVILNLPPDYRHIPPGHERIPYGKFKKNWSRWERERHWDKHPGKELRKEERHERKEDKGKGRHRGD